MPLRYMMFVLCVASAALCSPASQAAERPNVLMVMADDQTFHDAGCYGNKQVHTPHIDRLAEQGMRFTHCFTATAMCAPTRQQLYTGLFPVRNGAYPNHSRVYDGVRSIVHHLNDLGYRVALCGKKHFGPPQSFPFESVRRQGISKFMSQDASQPFFLLYTSHSPHLPWNAGDASRYDPAMLKLPPYLVDTPETRQAMARYYAEITDFDRELGECLEMLADAGQAENTLVIYTSEQGAQFPRCKWTCYDTGLRTGLVIRWPGKVAAGSSSDALVQYVDILPTLIAAAGGDPASVDTGIGGAGDGGRGFDGKSFLPVLLGDTHTHRSYVYGVQTTRGIINGSACYPVRSIRSEQYKLIWNLNHEEPFRNVLITGDGGGYWQSWVEAAETSERARRLVEGYQHRKEFELYDMKADPFELNDLAGDPAYGELRAKLLAELQKWMQQQGDRGKTTELKAHTRQKRRR